MAADNDTISGYTAAFEGFEASLNGGARSPLHARRREAIAHLQEHGLPTARFEAWRHTNPAPLAGGCFAPVVTAGKLSAEAILPFVVSGIDGPLLVFADGQFVPDLSRVSDLPDGV